MERNMLDALRRVRYQASQAMAELADEPPDTDRQMMVSVRLVASLSVQVDTLEDDVAGLKLAVSQLIR